MFHSPYKEQHKHQFSVLTVRNFPQTEFSFSKILWLTRLFRLFYLKWIPLGKAGNSQFASILPTPFTLLTFLNIQLKHICSCILSSHPELTVSDIKFFKVIIMNYVISRIPPNSLSHHFPHSHHLTKDIAFYHVIKDTQKN